MKRIYFYLMFAIVFSTIAFSCKNSPASYCVGEYDGTYIRDSAVAGNAIVEVIEVNSLTVNFVVSLDALSPVPLNNVQLQGGGQPYILYYNGIEGNLNGAASENDMQWTWMSSSDTISFTGVKQ